MISARFQRAVFLLCITLSAIAYLCLLWLATRPASRTADDPMPPLAREDAVSYLKDKGLYGSLQSAIECGSYQIEPGDQSPTYGGAAYRAINFPQGYRAVFTGEKLDIVSGKVEGPSWRLGLKLTGYGYGNRLMKPGTGAITADGNRIEISRAEVNGRTSLGEWYINGPDGLEQGFTLASAPGERGDGERLQFRIELEGDLRARPAGGGQAVDLIGANGERSLRYDHLHAYDVAGRELQSRMRVESGQVLLEVDDRDAVYPVTIDPTFSQNQKLTAADGAASNFFGAAVAIDGDTAVVGASPVGAVYVFVRSGGLWQLQQRVHVDNAGAFGIALGLSGDTFIAGAPGEEDRTGAAYVFKRTGGVWSQQQRLIASDRGENDNFGIAVGVSGDTVIVGARFSLSGPFRQQGSAYVFQRTGGTWTEQQHLRASDGGVAEFYGDAVAISGDTVVVGAAATSQEVPQQEHGATYVYVRQSGVWNLQQVLTSGATLGEGLFGCSVAIEGDTIVVGAIFSNAAYAFERTGGTWGNGQLLSGGFGEFGISASISGGTIVVGGRNQRIGDHGGQGAAFVFMKEFGQWHEEQMLTASDGAANDRFGNSVSISGDTIIVGSPFDQVGANASQGSAYVFGPNSPPAITASSVTVQQGRVIGANVATVSDIETAASLLNVSVVSGGTATGITLSNIVNTGGAITADVAASCTATSGTVRLRVTDGGGLTNEADLQVNVSPNDPPVINCPADVVKPADPAQCSAVVAFIATANDDCDGPLVPICAPPSGSTFARGTTTVTCTARDSSSHSTSCSFTVTVNDTQKPTIACPASLTVLTPRPGDPTAIVSYSAPTATDNCAVQSVICTPPSGAAFPLGATTVSCTATDTAGNSAGCSFSVTIFDVCLQDDTSPSTSIVWNSVTGDYRFCCAGMPYAGRGVVSRKGGVFTMTHNATDRRLIASLDSTQNKGTAALQYPAGVNRCVLNDRDIRNNSCQCSLP